MPEFKSLPRAKIAKDLTGMRFGNIIVLDFSHRVRTKYVTRIFWNGKCDCGNIRKVSTYHLTNKEVKSCGKCRFAKANRKAAARKLPNGVAALRAFFRSYLSNAKSRNKEFNLTFDQFCSIVSLNCHYCGSPPEPRSNNKNYNGNCAANGIDRMDNDLGYTIDNAVSCCTTCNLMKLDTDYLEFKIHVSQIVKHMRLF